jgi:hypothetical protein
MTEVHTGASCCAHTLNILLHTLNKYYVARCRMLQVGEQVARYGRAVHVCSCSVYGGASRAEQAAALSAGVDIIVATPGRLMDLLALHEGMQVGVTSPAWPSRQRQGPPRSTPSFPVNMLESE